MNSINAINYYSRNATSLCRVVSHRLTGEKPEVAKMIDRASCEALRHLAFRDFSAEKFQVDI